jgi:arylsulfatase A-like enzyme
VAGLVALAGPGPSGQAQVLPPIGQPPETRPNVLIFITDDQRADTLGVMTNTRQWFESEGVKFVNAYATTPVCCPSRASIMTGQYAHNHSVETNGNTEHLDQRSTLQRYLQDAGYLTGIAGKYFNQWTGDPPHFDEWTIFLQEHAGYYGATYNTGGAIQKVPTYSTDFIASETVRFLRGFESRDDRPWLMYVAPYAPHAPQKPARRHARVPVRSWQATPSVLERDRTDKPGWVVGKRIYGKNFSRVRETREGQIRSLLAADDLVDQVMRALGSLGEDQRTMAFFLSDNGFLWGEHGLKQKQAPYTASVRIPFLFRWPGHVAAGQTVTWPVATIDIVPTVFQALGIAPEPQHPVDGLPLLGSSRERVLLEFYRRFGRRVPTWASTRTELYQYTEWYGEDAQTVEFREYYDLRSDPWQLKNLLADPDPSNDPSPEVLAQLSEDLAHARRCSGSSPSGGASPSPAPSPSSSSDSPRACP